MNKVSLLPLSLSTLSLAPLELLDLGESSGSLPIYDLYTFIGAYKALTNVQNVGVTGNTLNLMPLGTVTATSTHSTPILAPDKDGIYREYPVDDPVWKGANWNGGAPLYDSLPDVYLQSNKVATNLAYPSEDLSDDLIWKANAITRVSTENDSDITFTLFEEVTGTQPGVHYVYSVNEQNTYPGYLCGSVFLKKGTNRYMGISMSLNNWASRQGVLFDLDLGVMVSLSPTYGESIADISYGIIPSGPGRYRVYLSFRKPGGIIGGRVIGTFSDSASPTWNYGAPEYIGNSARNGFFGGFQLEEGIFPSTYIPTTTAPFSIPATNYTFPAANIDPSDALIEFNIEWEGDDTNVLAIGATQLLEVIAGNLTLSDGTNSVALPVDIGNNSITVALSTNTMILTVNGSSVSDTYVPIASGLITIEENTFALTSKVLP